MNVRTGFIFALILTTLFSLGYWRDVQAQSTKTGIFGITPSVAVGSAYTTDFDSGLAVINATTTSKSYTTTTTLLMNAVCANTTGSAATLTILNTSGSAASAQYVSSQSLAANTTTVFNFGPHGIVTAAIWASSGTVNAINCQFSGYQ